MNRQSPLHQKSSLQLTKVCLSCFGIAGTAVLASGILKLGVINNDRKVDQAFRLLRPLNESINKIVEHLLR